MFPSYHATGDEEDFTRGRATACGFALSLTARPDSLVPDHMMRRWACVGARPAAANAPVVDMARIRSSSSTTERAPRRSPGGEAHPTSLATRKSTAAWLLSSTLRNSFRSLALFVAKVTA